MIFASYYIAIYFQRTSVAKDAITLAEGRGDSGNDFFFDWAHVTYFNEKKFYSSWQKQGWSSYFESQKNYLFVCIWCSCGYMDGMFPFDIESVSKAKKLEGIWLNQNSKSCLVVEGHHATHYWVTRHEERNSSPFVAHHSAMTTKWSVAVARVV